SAARRASALPAGGVILQEYIPGNRREAVNFLLDQKGNPAFAFQKTRHRNFRVTNRLGTVSESCDLPPFAGHILRLLQAIGWWGPAAVETIIDSRDGLP